MFGLHPPPAKCAMYQAFLLVCTRSRNRQTCFNACCTVTMGRFATADVYLGRAVVQTYYNFKFSSNLLDPRRTGRLWLRSKLVDNLIDPRFRLRLKMRDQGLIYYKRIKYTRSISCIVRIFLG